MSLLPGYLGARYGPRLIRRALDRGGALAFAAVLLPSLLLGASFGAAFVWCVNGGLLIGAMCSGLVATGSTMTAGDAVLRWWWNRRRDGRARVALAPSGVSSTAYRRSRAALFVPLSTAIMFSGYGIAVASMAVARGLWWLAVAFGLVGAYALSMLVPFALGRVVAGGLYLTPAGVEHRFGLMSAFVPWEELRVPREELPFHLVIAPGSWEKKSFPWVIPMDVNDRVHRGQVAVPTPYLPIRGAEVVAELSAYAVTRPHLRRYLGTDRSLEWESPHDGYVV